MISKQELRQLSLKEKGRFFQDIIKELIRKIKEINKEEQKNINKKERHCFIDVELLLSFVCKKYKLDIFTLRKYLRSIKSIYTLNNQVVCYIDNKPIKRTAWHKRWYNVERKIKPLLEKRGINREVLC